MSESFLGNNDHEIRAKKLDLASSDQEAFQEAVIEELGAVVTEGRRVLEERGLAMDEHLGLAFQWSMSQVLRQSHYSVRTQFAYAATRELVSSVEPPPSQMHEDASPHELVAAHREQLIESLREELGDFAEDSFGEAEFSPETKAELDAILALSVEEAADRSREPGFIRSDVLSETLDYFREIARERIDGLQREADSAMNKIGARANESQQELRNSSQARRDLEVVEECIRTEQIDRAVVYIKKVRNAKRAEKLKKVLDDAVLRKARNIIIAGEADSLSVTLDIIQYQSSDPYGRNLMRVALSPDFLEAASWQITNRRLEGFEAYVDASYKSSRIAIREALNLTHFNNVLDMARHGAPEHAINSYIEENIHGSNNKEYAKSAALSYMYS